MISVFCVVVGIDGTTKGGNEEAKPIHVECLVDGRNWRINREVGVIYGKEGV